MLLEIYNSPHVVGKVNEILQILFKKEECKDVLLMSFICYVMAIDVSYDHIETILGFRLNPLYFEKYKEIKELVLINGNNIRFKSSSIAYHVIANNNFNSDILEIVCKMVNVLSNHAYSSKNISVLKLVISFSNLRMIFNRKDKEISKIYISFYENARKTQHFFGFSIHLQLWRFIITMPQSYIWKMQVLSQKNDIQRNHIRLRA